MAANDERPDARSRQMITARRNQLRNQAKNKSRHNEQNQKPKANHSNSIKKPWVLRMMRSRMKTMTRTRKQHMNPKGKGEDHQISEEQYKRQKTKP